MAYDKEKVARAKAIEKKNMMKIREINPLILEKSGIYFLTRTDENDISYFYIGQSNNCLRRMASHMIGYQHIDLSIKKRGFYSDINPFGWKINMIEYPEEKLDEMERHWILTYMKKGYQCRYNKTSGGQGNGKEKINDFRPIKGYRDGLNQGYINASREIAYLFDKHLNFLPKSEKPNARQEGAMKKFQTFLDYYKDNDDD